MCLFDTRFLSGFRSCRIIHPFPLPPPPVLPGDSCMGAKYRFNAPTFVYFMPKSKQVDIPFN